MKKRKKVSFKLLSIIIGFIIVFLLVFALLIGFVGFNRFTETLTKEYNDSAYRTALTASSFINTDNITSYMENKDNSEEYNTTKAQLDMLCNTQEVSKIVVLVPEENYTNFSVLFESINTTQNTSMGNSSIDEIFSKENGNRFYKNIHEEKSERETIVKDRILSSIQPEINSMIPLTDSDGNVVATLIVQKFMEELSYSRRSYILWVGIITAILMIISIISAYRFIRKQIAVPIKEVTDEAERFANEKVKRKSNLREDSRVKEINSLENSINKMETDTINYIENLTTVTKENERIGAELKLASTIQESVLPNTFPAFPNRSEFDIYASMKPAREVSGDFYDFFLVDDNHLALVIADVSDKGIPAALFMMNTKILINDHTLTGNSPSEILTLVNNRICSNKNGMFVTVWLGILEISTGKLVAANAGHEDPVIYRKNKKFELVKTRHGLVIGAMANFKYEDYEIQLEEGDKLFIYTDGIPEATNAEYKMFGLEKMISSLNEVSNKSVKDIIENIGKNVDIFVDGTTQFDDLTMLCLELKTITKHKEDSNEKEV